jgi:hypothetical protein
MLLSGAGIFSGTLSQEYFGLQILVNHLRCLLYPDDHSDTGIFELVNAIRNKSYGNLLKPLPWLVLFVVLAIGANFSSLFSTYEYGKYSIRGKSELSTDAENKTSGLDKDYATQWSYGIGETLTLLVPDFMGGSSNRALKTSSNTYDYIKTTYGASEARKFIGNVPLYWGKQPVTSGPVYVGAVIVFLFFLGMFIVKGPVKWWLFSVTAVSILLAWGHNFNFLTDFMLDYFPGYNKFRTVSMTLVMAEFAVPLLGILALREIIINNIPRKDFLKAMKYSLFGLGGLIVVLMMISGSFDMVSPMDEQFRSQGLDSIVDAIQKDRLALLRSDAFSLLVLLV